jgi:hypothetical protein
MYTLTNRPMARCKCNLCGSMYNFGFGQYHGTILSGYDMAVCDVCYEMNWDGWAPQYEKRLLEQLRGNNVKIPPRNAKGFLPREFSRP